MRKDVLAIPRHKLPRHITIIMDGNGRWAQKQGKPRVHGHEMGSVTARDLIRECAELHRQIGVPEILTLYSFSLENWNRPLEEVSFLMDLYVRKMRQEEQTLMEENVRFRQIGRRDSLPDPVVEQILRSEEATKNNTGMLMVLALNYGSRGEITDAMREVAEKVKKGELSPGDITEQTVADHLYTRGLPDPDILIRTAGEMRVSNYMLWQISYAELLVSPVLWPDFTAEHLHEAMIAYSRRQRRFGALIAPEQALHSTNAD